MGGYKGTGLEPDSVYTGAVKPRVRITYFGGAEVRAGHVKGMEDLGLCDWVNDGGAGERAAGKRSYCKESHPHGSPSGWVHDSLNSLGLQKTAAHYSLDFYS